jgi:hypothetical protein
MTYTVRATTSGKQHALAMSKRLVDDHPEFARGRFVAHVVAPGHMLVSTQDVDEAEDGDESPVLDAFLAFLGEQMRAHPEMITPFTRADVEGLDELLAGVEADRDEDLGDFTLP